MALSSNGRAPGTSIAEPALTERKADEVEPSTIWQFMGYFLLLGTVGFGGPIALAGYMQRDLVEKRRWISKNDYVEGLALSQLSPGPLAAQLAIYLGWVRAGILGATLVGAAFVLPSFLMVIALSALYVHFGGLPWMQGLFYGIGAAVIAIVVRSAIKLARLTIGKSWLLLALFTIMAVITAWTETEIIWLFVLCGIVALSVQAPPKWLAPRAHLVAVPWLPWLVTGVHGPASAATLGKILLYFAAAGTFVFGSGLAIVPFLYGGVVTERQWLNDRQFLDAVAVAMITPGPVVITVAFIGYLVAGLAGAIMAGLGVFLPCYLMVVIFAPFFRRFAQNPQIHAFVAGVTSAAAGAIAGAAFVIGRRAIIDLATVLIFAATFALITWIKKVPEPLIICAAGIAGLLITALR